MKPRVYLETTIVSYLTAWRSRELVMAGNQEATREWWDDHRQDFDVFVFEAVFQEALARDADAVERRLGVLKDIAELEITDAVRDLATALVADVPFPEKAQIDALHIAVATVHGMDYLLTWNCRHIANATLRHGIESVCAVSGYTAPVICTPLELLE
jgi:hypothetical protein